MTKPINKQCKHKWKRFKKNTKEWRKWGEGEQGYVDVEYNLDVCGKCGEISHWWPNCPCWECEEKPKPTIIVKDWHDKTK